MKVQKSFSNPPKTINVCKTTSVRWRLTTNHPETTAARRESSLQSLRIILPSLKLRAIKSFSGTLFNCDLLTFFTKLKHQWLLLRSVFASVIQHTTLKNIKARQP
jgi:hypothetical protein